MKSLNMTQCTTYVYDIDILPEGNSMRSQTHFKPAYLGPWLKFTHIYGAKIVLNLNFELSRPLIAHTVLSVDITENT